MRPPRLTVFLALLLWTLGARADDDFDDALKQMEREDRVRVLQALTWEIQAAPVEGELRLDGRVDEPAWSRAQAVANFYQRERNEGLPATERTEVRVLYDASTLYVGFRCLDGEPERVKARAIFRDESGGADDLIAVMLDAFHDHRTAIQFITNANGLVFELLQSGETERTRNSDFDTVWTARGARTARGWEAEIAIPFKSLRFAPPASGEEVVMGIGFKRNVPRKNEEMHWPFVGNDSSWYRPAELGHLRGLKRVQPGRNLQFRPYTLAGVNRDYALAGGERRLDAGADAKWGITTGLTADFTVNTDFAQEEADVQQINFTRFSLFFPEKRQFFLENQRMFQFGLPRETDLVFTRRIGLGGEGEVIPILGGVRLAGREGRTSIGSLNLTTEEALGFPAENFTVLRVRRDFFSRASAGALFTNRQGGSRFNRVYGVDVSLPFKEVWSFEGFLAAVDEPGESPSARAAFTRFAYEADRVGFTYRYLDIGESFRPGVGFVQRRDMRNTFGEARYSPRLPSPWIRQIHFNGRLRYIENHDDVLETREREGDVRVEFESGDVLVFEYSNGYEFIDAPFALRPDVVIPPGGYHTDTLEARLETFRRRHSTLNLNYRNGGFWGGERDTLSLRLNYRMSKHVGVLGNYEINWIDLPQGKFTTHLFSGRLQLAFRSDVVLMSLLQYNTDNRQLSTNVRFNWIPRPGSDFFIVYNELDAWGEAFGVKNRSLVVKLNYLFAL